MPNSLSLAVIFLILSFAKSISFCTIALSFVRATEFLPLPFKLANEIFIFLSLVCLKLNSFSFLAFLSLSLLILA